ncbi:MAG: sulfite exporter TauE/SafE family protein [Pseudomonadota bacterium]
MPPILSLLPIVLTGLLGSVHCIGMCGGIVSAFSAAGTARPAFPVAVLTVTPLSASAPVRVLTYNLGRIGSYALAGALAGGLAGAAARLSQLALLQHVLYWLANGMLVALGLYLMDAWRGLAQVEALGQGLWRHVRALLAPLLPMDSLPKAFALGALWGWVPCAMVYSVLLTAMLSGSAASGAATMVAFGLGTLPMMLGLGLALRQMARSLALRRASGLLVLGFGVLGLVRAWRGVSLGWVDALCLTPPVLP